MMIPTTRPWYVARLKPGASREAPVRVAAPVERCSETIAERSLRDAGFEVYFPRMRKEIVHHRTKKRIVRSFPLFTGYAFVNAFSMGPVRATECDGIAEIMGVKIDGRPWPVSAALVERFRTAEQNEVFDDTQSARIRREEEGRTQRETTMMRFPQGAVVKIENPKHLLHGFHASVVSVTGRGLVRVMIEAIHGVRTVSTDFIAQDLEVLA
jgi:hypothetical protein